MLVLLSLNWDCSIFIDINNVTFDDQYREINPNKKAGELVISQPLFETVFYFSIFLKVYVCLSCLGFCSRNDATNIISLSTHKQ